MWAGAIIRVSLLRYLSHWGKDGPLPEPNWKGSAKTISTSEASCKNSIIPTYVAWYRSFFFNIVILEQYEFLMNLSFKTFQHTRIRVGLGLRKLLHRATHKSLMNSLKLGSRLTYNNIRDSKPINATRYTALWWTRLVLGFGFWWQKQPIPRQQEWNERGEDATHVQRSLHAVRSPAVVAV